MPNHRQQDAADSETGLLRRIGVVSATALVVSNMIGTGIFTSTGFLAGGFGISFRWSFSIWLVGGAHRDGGGALLRGAREKLPALRW